MGRVFTLREDYEGYRAQTRFRHVAQYGSWHVAAAKLEPVHGLGRLEVTEAELERLFRESERQ